MKVLSGTGASTRELASQEATSVPEFVQSHGSQIQGTFAVDAGSTALLGPR